MKRTGGARLIQNPRWRNGVVVAIVAAMAALLLLSGCSSETATSQQKDDQTLSLTTRLKKYELGGVEYTVTWKDPTRSTAVPIKFTVKMDTHSGSLSDYDLGKASTLANDSGQQIKAIQWDSPGDGHHGTGALYFPATDSTGKPLINADTKYVEWVISDLAGVAEKKTIRWEITQ